MSNCTPGDRCTGDPSEHFEAHFKFCKKVEGDRSTRSCVDIIVRGVVAVSDRGIKV